MEYYNNAVPQKQTTFQNQNVPGRALYAIPSRVLPGYQPIPTNSSIAGMIHLNNVSKNEARNER